MDKTKKSRLLNDIALKTFPGGINHNIRHYDPYPFQTKRANKQYIWDVDDNKYTDYWMGHMALILGHSPENIIENVKQQIDYGTLMGTTNVIALEFANKIQEIFLCSEMVRLSSTGTEATMYATRLARAYTQKKKIVKIEGGWHGGNTALHKSISKPFDKKSSGILEEESKNTIIIPYNDIEKTADIIEENRNDIACVIVEPLLGHGCIPIKIDYLKMLREKTEKIDSILILDEVITGFRLAFGGAQEYYNIKPDLCTFGKISGGGFPIGGITGLKEIMEKSNPIKQKDDLCWIGGGTFSGNPMTMVAGLATIKYLENNKSRVYQKINDLGDKTRKNVDKIFHDSNIKTKTTGLGSLFVTHFLNNEKDDIITARDLESTNMKNQYEYYMMLMSYFDIFFLPSHNGAISDAHNIDDVNHLITSTDKISRELKSN